MLRQCLAVTVCVMLFATPVRAAPPVPVTIKAPVTSPLSIEGTGLCIASAISQDPLNDFGFFNTATYNGGMNAFMEGHINDRVESVIRTLLDLSNNNNVGIKFSYGDFTDAMLPICQTGGCGFSVNDSITGFGARARGFLNVTQDMKGKPIHFGFYADDAVSLTFFNKDADVLPIVTRPPTLGLPRWRTTNTVTFEEPGLYPLEILYIEIAEHAELEMSYHMGTFSDFEIAASTPGGTNLKSAGFTLFPATSFFQTLSGAPSYPQDLDKCRQCDRQFVNQPGNSGCDAGYYCNEAALCAPCDTALFCGPACSPCDGATPFCVHINGTMQCGGCRGDADCEVGFTCDPVEHECNECNENSDCPRGEICEDHSCLPCQTSDACAPEDVALPGACSCSIGREQRDAPWIGLTVLATVALLGRRRRRSCAIRRADVVTFSPTPHCLPVIRQLQREVAEEKTRILPIVSCSDIKPPGNWSARYHGAPAHFCRRLAVVCGFHALPPGCP